MRLPWLQIDADGATRAETLGRLLGVGDMAGLGLAIRLWRWSLELAPDGDFSGGPHDSRLVAAAIGWAPDDSERLENELIRSGLVAGIRAGLVRIRGLDRYKRAWEKNKRRKPAPVVPVTGNNPAPTRAEPARKTETETEKETTSVEEVFDHWRLKVSPKAKLDPKRRRLIENRRREGFEVEDLKKAIDGYVSSPFHQGQNERHQKYLDLGLMLRDAGHVEAGMGILGITKSTTRAVKPGEDLYAQP